MGIIAGLSISTAITAQSEWVCPEGFEGQELRVLNWSTYIAEDTISNFEDACDVDVDYDLFANNEDLLEILRDGEEWDIVVPSDYMVAIMIEEGLLQPLNLDLIPNFANVSETFVNPPFDPGNVYSVPYQWGTISVGYNQTIIDEPITTWQQVWDYDGPIAWLDDQRSMLSLALLVLGYDPNTDSEAEINAAADFLIDHSNNLIAIAQDDGQALLAAGYVDMVIEYSGDIFQLNADCDCEDYAYTIPDEGAVVWTDNMAIPASAPNPELAHVFIDYVLDPQVSADISNFVAYGSPNAAAIEQGLIDEELLNNPGVYPFPSVTQRLFFIEQTPDLFPLYDAAWQRVVDAVGT
jgi:spermidine/putrescine transport system substrate-binding protein